MAVNLEAIRKRIMEMSGQSKNSRVQLWKPTAGKHRIRGVPWANTVDGMPFRELHFYYIGDGPRILAPSQFGKPDPVADLIRKCYSSGKPDDRVLAKKLHAKMTTYMAIIDRAQEDKGVQVWSFNPFIYQRLLSFFTVEDIGDFLDPNVGFDLEVEIVPSKKMFNGKQVMDTTVDAARKQTKLSNDPEQAKKWLDGVPNIDDMYTQKSTAEVEQILNAWLAGGAAGDEASGGDEVAGRGNTSSKDALDTLVAEVKAEVKAPVVEAKIPKKAKKADADLDEAPAAKQSLDDAFEDLMKDE
jgi:hypothetical protein